jgi:hypothetical protein
LRRVTLEGCLTQVVGVAFGRLLQKFVATNFLRSMQEFFSLFDVFFDASFQYFWQQNGKFYNSPLKKNQL